ncbi:MAG: ROK family protein [Planctomycetes bacterium]|nr:ROK family protein [Planctomycetota bacterium]
MSLLGAGVVERIAGGPTRPGPMLGRPAEYFGLARRRPRHVVVELGVNKTQVAALPVAGPVGDIRTAGFSTTQNLDEFERRLTNGVATLNIARPLAVLVSVPGIVDESERRVLYSPNLHWTEGTRLFEAIARAIDAPLVVVQEIRALALGYLVHAEPRDSFLWVDIGDGVGGALVIDGRLQSGTLPFACEIGHTPVSGNRRACGCGGVGCLETLLGRKGLLRSAQRNGRKSRGWGRLVSELAGKPLPAWLRATLAEAGRVIAGAINTAGVSKVVVSGDLLERSPEVIEHLAKSINALALWGRFGSVRVESAPRERLLGLARAALDRVVLAPTAAEEAIGLGNRGTG